MAKEPLYIEQLILHRLISLAMSRETTNYLDLAQETGLPDEWPQMGQSLSPVLYNVLEWCEKHRLPRLTVLVVRRSGADKGIPGAGFWQAVGMADLDRDAKRIMTEKMTKEVYDFFFVQARHLVGEPIQLAVDK